MVVKTKSEDEKNKLSVAHSAASLLPVQQLLSFHSSRGRNVVNAYLTLDVTPASAQACRASGTGRASTSHVTSWPPSGNAYTRPLLSVLQSEQAGSRAPRVMDEIERRAQTCQLLLGTYCKQKPGFSRHPCVPPDCIRPYNGDHLPPS